jgi:hypothetical protein
VRSSDEFALQILRAYRGGVRHERERIVALLLSMPDAKGHELAVIIANTDNRDEVATQPGKKV